MKKGIYPLLLGAIIFLGYGSPLASEEPSQDSPRAFERLSRGVVNTFTSPLELPVQMYIRAKFREEKTKNPMNVFGGYLEGIPMGLIYFPWRFTAGIYDIVTFPFSRFDNCIISPDYISLSTKYLKED